VIIIISLILLAGCCFLIKKFHSNHSFASNEEGSSDSKPLLRVTNRTNRNSYQACMSGMKRSFVTLTGKVEETVNSPGWYTYDRQDLEDGLISIADTVFKNEHYSPEDQKRIKQVLVNSGRSFLNNTYSHPGGQESIKNEETGYSFSFKWQFKMSNDDDCVDFLYELKTKKSTDPSNPKLQYRALDSQEV